MATIAPAVARSTFPLNGRVVNHPVDPALYSIFWLKNLIPRQLASILVERAVLHSSGIPAEDAWGDNLRARVANGWCVFRRLTKISEDVHRMDEKEVLGSGSGTSLRILHTLRSKFDLFQEREKLVLSRRLDYIGSLDKSLARDYKMLMILLSATFRASPLNTDESHVPWVFDFGYGIDGPRLIRRGSSWLAWYILNQGPDLFWQQWWMDPAEHYIRDRSVRAWFEGSNTCFTDYVRKCASREWVDVNEKWHTLQREHATAVQSALHIKASQEPGGFSSFDPMSYFQSYSSYRRRHGGDGGPAVKETLGEVPFHVEFASWLAFQECTQQGSRGAQNRAVPR